MSEPSPRLFTPWHHGRLTLRNRVVMAPMTRRMAAEDGVPTPEILAYYRRRAAAEVGLIVSEGTAIDSLHAYDTLTVPRFETPVQLAAWKTVVQAIHEEGGAFAPQLWHTGRMGADPIAPSPGQAPPRRDGVPRPPAREMTAEDFAQVLNAFDFAARGARDIGCDALEIHGAHGYLLDSFLSPVDNRRTDDYGGSVENRMRFPLEVVRRIRQVVGPEFPIIYRFSQWKVDDYRELKFKNSRELEVWVSALGEAGVDILHVSTRHVLDPGFEDEGTTTLAGWSRTLSGLPVIGVGSVSLTLPMDRAYGSERDTTQDPGPALDLVERGEIDLLAVGRALIPNVEWVRLVRQGQWRDLVPFNKSQLETLH